MRGAAWAPSLRHTATPPGCCEPAAVSRDVLNFLVRHEVFDQDDPCCGFSRGRVALRPGPRVRPCGPGQESFERLSAAAPNARGAYRSEARPRQAAVRGLATCAPKVLGYVSALEDSTVNGHVSVPGGRSKDPDSSSGSPRSRPARRVNGFTRHVLRVASVGRIAFLRRGKKGRDAELVDLPPGPENQRLTRNVAIGLCRKLGIPREDFGLDD